jgi:hypothetical protein
MSPSQSSPLFPWIAEEGVSPLTQEIKDPVSGASITLPRLNGLTVNEVLFAQWASEAYPFLTTGGVDSAPKTIVDISEFAHRFLCLRMELADWGDGDLLFKGEPLTPADSLTMPMADGQKRAAPMYLLWLIYGFFVEEQTAWLSGKTEGGMMATILSAIAPLSTGAGSTAISSTNTQDGSAAEASPEPQPTLSKSRSKQPKSESLAA